MTRQRKNDSVDILSPHVARRPIKPISPLPSTRVGLGEYVFLLLIAPYGKCIRHDALAHQLPCNYWHSRWPRAFSIDILFMRGGFLSSPWFSFSVCDWVIADSHLDPHCTRLVGQSEWVARIKTFKVPRNWALNCPFRRVPPTPQFPPGLRFPRNKNNRVHNDKPKHLKRPEVLKERSGADLNP